MLEWPQCPLPQPAGFQRHRSDSDANAIGILQSIVAQEAISSIDPRVYDINRAELNANYGFIACTVTLMFLDPGRVEAVLADMQAHTVPGGSNLIVCAMDTAAHPCPVGFPFTLHKGQLGTIYQGWEMLKYNEDLGTMHNGAAGMVPVD